jgi:hypothetical protein
MLLAELLATPLGRSSSTRRRRFAVESQALASTSSVSVAHVIRRRSSVFPQSELGQCRVRVGRITHQIPPLLHRQHHVEPRALYVVSAGDLHYEFGVEESVRAVRLARSVRRSFMFVHRATTISLAAQHNIPAVYSEPVWVAVCFPTAPMPTISFVAPRPIGSHPAWHVAGGPASSASGPVPQSILLRADEVIE